MIDDYFAKIHVAVRHLVLIGSFVGSGKLVVTKILVILGTHARRRSIPQEDGTCEKICRILETANCRYISPRCHNVIGNIIFSW